MKRIPFGGLKLAWIPEWQHCHFWRDNEENPLRGIETRILPRCTTGSEQDGDNEENPLRGIETSSTRFHIASTNACDNEENPLRGIETISTNANAMVSIFVTMKRIPFGD